MTPQEQEMIDGLIDRVNKTELAEKDIDAEQRLQQGLGRNPDALYILAQTVLVQKYALEQAQSQLSMLQAQVHQLRQQPGAAQPAHSGSFLGNLLHRNDSPPPPPPPQGYAPAAPQYMPPPPPPPGYGQPMGYAPAPQGGGFLQGAMQTAAGVAAGALAFEGIESLMHGFGHAAGYGQEFGSFGGGQSQPEIINNYYGDERGGDHGVTADERAEGAREDRFADTSTGGDDDSSRDLADTSSDDYSSSDDDSSFDDGGSGGDDNSF